MNRQIITTFLNAASITNTKVKKDNEENKVNYPKYFNEGSLLAFTRENNARESMASINKDELQNYMLINMIEVYMVKMHQLIRGKVTNNSSQKLFDKYKELTDKKGITAGDLIEVLFSEYDYIEQMVNELKAVEKLEDKDYISKMAKKISEVINQYDEKDQNFFKISYFLLCELREKEE